MLYFYDPSGRYIGCREQKEGEDVPECAVLFSPKMQDGKDYYLVDGQWKESDAQREQFDSIPDAVPSIEERVSALEQGLLEMMMGGV